MNAGEMYTAIQILRRTVRELEERIEELEEEVFTEEDEEEPS